MDNSWHRHTRVPAQRHSTFSTVVYLRSRVMELDRRSRCWIVTVPWHDATHPTDEDVPDLDARLIKALYSAKNGSMSVFYLFKNPQRASRLTNTFPQDHVVVKVSKESSYDEFCQLPSDWVMTKEPTAVPVAQCDGDDECAKGTTEPRTTGHIRARSDDESSDDELQTLIRRRRKVKNQLQNVGDLTAQLMLLEQSIHSHLKALP
jgi:hypothetical protein